MASSISSLVSGRPESSPHRHADRGEHVVSRAQLLVRVDAPTLRRSHSPYSRCARASSGRSSVRPSRSIASQYRSSAPLLSKARQRASTPSAGSLPRGRVVSASCLSASRASPACSAPAATSTGSLATSQGDDQCIPWCGPGVPRRRLGIQDVEEKWVTAMAEEYSELANERVSAANGVDYAYRDTGGESGLPLVLLQHFRGNLDNWDPALIDALATDPAGRDVRQRRSRRLHRHHPGHDRADGPRRHRVHRCHAVRPGGSAGLFHRQLRGAADRAGPAGDRPQARPGVVGAAGRGRHARLGTGGHRRGRPR